MALSNMSGAHPGRSPVLPHLPFAVAWELGAMGGATTGDGKLTNVMEWTYTEFPFSVSHCYNIWCCPNVFVIFSSNWALVGEGNIFTNNMSLCNFGIQHIWTVQIHINLKMEIIFRNWKKTNQEASWSWALKIKVIALSSVRTQSPKRKQSPW